MSWSDCSFERSPWTIVKEMATMLTKKKNRRPIRKWTVLRPEWDMEIELLKKVHVEVHNFLILGFAGLKQIASYIFLQQKCVYSRTNNCNLDMQSNSKAGISPEKQRWENSKKRRGSCESYYRQSSSYWFPRPR